MKNEPVKIQTIEHHNHDVLHIVTEKPEGVKFTPGQATEIFIDKEGWRNEGRPFTFTCLPNDGYLEFMIKTYPDRKGVTNELLSLKKGDMLILNEVFGAIEYKGPGTFIAGGAGVTPFIAILRDLHKKGDLGGNKLLFANKTASDIILKDEFEIMLGRDFVNILSEENNPDYSHGHISEAFIKEQGTPLDTYFYLCGPPSMMDAVGKQLAHLNIPKERIVTEDFD